MQNYESLREKTIYEDKRYVYAFIKRCMDFILALIGLIVLIPVFIITAIAIKVESKGKVIFVQERVGYRGKKFKMYKFRSMVNDAEELKEKLLDKNEMSGPMFKMREDPRVTKVGKFIRKTSIDELPQIINVIKGEMSLVGPRPSLPSEVEKFEEWMLERLSVKPGLTCYWQISGRNDIDFYDWMKMDIKYINDRNLIVDIKIILKTFAVLFGDEHAR